MIKNWDKSTETGQTPSPVLSKSVAAEEEESKSTLKEGEGGGGVDDGVVEVKKLKVSEAYEVLKREPNIGAWRVFSVAWFKC